jgi:hypothetical protein
MGSAHLIAKWETLLRLRTAILLGPAQAEACRDGIRTSGNLRSTGLFSTVALGLGEIRLLHLARMRIKGAEYQQALKWQEMRP